MSLWYGEDKLAELTLADSGGRCIKAVVFEQSSQRVLLTNLKVYKANLPDIEKVYYDAIYTEFDKLTYQKESYVTDDLTLSTVGKYGSSISWQSDSEDVVEKDGTVHVPSSGTVSVTLQARFYSGGEERERTYSFTVAASQKDETPRVKKMLLEENFDDDTLHANWSLYQMVEPLRGKRETKNHADTNRSIGNHCKYVFFSGSIQTVWDIRCGVYTG